MNEYPNFEETTGYGTGEGLCGWNCRHSFHLFDPAVDKPIYTKEKLQELNNKTVSYNGKKVPVYEATQIQRGFERKIREYKTKSELASVCGDGRRELIANAKVAEYQAKMRSFIHQTRIARRRKNEQI